MVHLHIHLDVRASCNDGLEQIAPLVLSPRSERPICAGHETVAAQRYISIVMVRTQSPAPCYRRRARLIDQRSLRRFGSRETLELTRSCLPAWSSSVMVAGSSTVWSILN